MLRTPVDVEAQPNGRRRTRSGWCSKLGLGVASTTPMPVGDPEKPVWSEVNHENPALATEKPPSNFQAIEPQQVSLRRFRQHPDKHGLVSVYVLVLGVRELAVEGEHEQLDSLSRD